jgi:glycine/serine hydroxymethyltransferase
MVAANLWMRSRTLAIERAKILFGAKFANVQPHSGAQATRVHWQKSSRMAGSQLSLAEPTAHVVLVDLRPMGLTGKLAEAVAIEMGGGPSKVYGGKVLAAFDELKS